MSKLQNDLQIVFGFSRANAEKAEHLWRDGKLPQNYQCALNRIFHTPFDKLNPTGQEERAGPQATMTRLNYELSTGEL